MARLNKGNAAEYQRSTENVSRLRRIADDARSIGIAARAARAADKARWQTPYPVANLEPRDRRTREYREWAAKQQA